MRLFWAFFFILFSVACVQQGGATRGASKNASTTGGGTNTTGTGTTALAWTGSNLVTKTLQVNSDSTLDFYLKGTSVHNYLSASTNKQNVYCLKTTFANSTNALYLRGVPYSITEAGTNSTVRMLKFNFNDYSSNGLCTPSAASSVGTLLTVCPTCLTLIKSSALDIFKCPTGVTQVIGNSSCPSSANKIVLSDLPTISLNINPNNNTNTQTNSCTNAQCISSGFSCCLENNCVTDGQVRDSARIQNSTEYQQAKQVIALNPLSFVNYPQFYYVCPNYTHTATVGTTTVVVNDTGLTAKINDYNCIQEIKYKTTASVNNDPFHKFFSNVSATLTGTAGIAANCNGGTCKCIYDGDLSNTITEQASTYYYKSVMNRLYDRCGCKKDNFTLEQKAVACPAYDYVFTYDSNGKINDVACYTPSPVNYSVVPIENISNVSLKSKAVPHIFYTATGTALYEYLDVVNNASTAEGDKFQYLDTAKYYPDTTSYVAKNNMTAILGKLTANSAGAYPAKTFTVKPQSTYYITVESGNYTPCRTCGQDSWFNGYTAFPQSTDGVGIRPTGYTTSPNTYGKGTNTTLSNWEDLIFGRACWLPPTMLPFSHSPKVLPDQRVDRLKTQATYFVNGYQRDWYGFNKGAVIGSFDGVHWFAIGRARIAQATTNKLFIAINGIMGDVTEDNDVVVSIRKFEGPEQGSAALYDWDPNDYLSSKRNDGATCQRYHDCQTDSDCISSLGWEYMCADVRSVKSLWPKFTATTAAEVGTFPAATTANMEDLTTLLGSHPSMAKRCVYRGAGTPCYADIANINNTDMAKHLTCAPNFFCAKHTLSAFNDELARTPHPLDDIPNNKDFYGHDADVLGRPLYYIGSATLPATATAALISNITNWVNSVPNSISSFSAANIGLCRPGKMPGSSTASSMAYQHLNTTTPTQLTDKINQIGPCDSSKQSIDQFSSCPYIGPDGNLSYATATTQIITPISVLPANITGITNYQLVSMDSVSFDVNAATDVIDFSYFPNTSAEKLIFTGLSGAGAATLWSGYYDSSTKTCDYSSPSNEGTVTFASTTVTLSLLNTTKQLGYLCFKLTDFTANGSKTMGNISIISRGGGAYGGDYAYTQNACGGAEGKTSAVASAPYAFASLELRSATVSTVNPSLMRNACFRRAGALCHTNLDCSPNILHSELAQTLGSSNFGNIPEYQYWSEELICTQQAIEPDPYNSTTSDYTSYQMGLNRCCREIGKDITIYTEDYPGNVALGILPGTFNTATYGWMYPSSSQRYSRLSNVDKSKLLSVIPIGQFPRISSSTVSAAGTPSITDTYQWQSIGQSAKNTCCGGGWVRKFSDGTHNWETFADRLHLDVENFKCLNFIYPSIPTDPSNPNDRLPKSISSTYTASWNWPGTSNLSFTTELPHDGTLFNTSILINAASATTGSVYLIFNDIDTASTLASTAPSSGSATANLFQVKLDGGVTYSALDYITTVSIVANATYITNIQITYNYTTTVVTGKDLAIPLDQFTQEVQNYCKGWNNPTSTDRYGCAQFPFNLVPGFDAESFSTTAPAEGLLSIIHGMTSTVIDTYFGNYKTNPLAFFKPINAESSSLQVFIDGASGDSAETPRTVPIILPSYVPRNDTPASWGVSGLEILTCNIVAKDTYIGQQTTTQAKNSARTNDFKCKRCQAVLASTATPCFSKSAATTLYTNWQLSNDAATDGSSSLLLDTNSSSVAIDKTSDNYDCYFCYEPNEKVLAVTHTATQANLSLKVRYPIKSMFPSSAAEEARALYTRAETKATYPGNILYYMNKLGKLELNGIPQIYQEPVYCNNNCSQLVPNIFEVPTNSTGTIGALAVKFTMPAVGAATLDANYNFTAPALSAKSADTNFACMASGQEKLVTDSRGIKTPAIFAANDFTCCRKLGETVSDDAQCCSGFGKSASSGTFTCALPPKTDLYVYFNRFVTSENGYASGLPDDSLLTDDDFYPQSGEPKNTAEVYAKMIKIAKVHCSTNDYKRGQAFGRYFGEPNPQDPNSLAGAVEVTDNAFFWSIVDSVKDNWRDGTKGYVDFYDGFRWNHHVYCKK